MELFVDAILRNSHWKSTLWDTLQLKSRQRLKDISVNPDGINGPKFFIKIPEIFFENDKETVSKFLNSEISTQFYTVERWNYINLREFT